MNEHSPPSASLLLKRGGQSLMIGAAIGTGIAARAAARGGADFLLAVNSARFRMMGVSSVAAHLALRDNNAFVAEFASEEILPQSEIPVFFGAAAFDPRIEIEEFVARLAERGFAGVANSRSAHRYSGGFREALERCGLGIARDLALFSAARRIGLLSLAYVRTAADAVRFSEAGVDMMCLSFASNSGEFGDAPLAPGLEDAAELARGVFRAARKRRPDLVCLVTGAPIIDPGQMLEICNVAKAQGYIGGSTIDRLPLQHSIESRTAEFKQAILRAGPGQAARRKAANFEERYGIVADSRAMQRLVARIGRIVAGDFALHISGERGTGKSFLISVMSKMGALGRRIETLHCANLSETDLKIALVGCAAGAAPGVERRRIGWLESLGHGALVLENIDQTSPSFQDFVVGLWTTQRFRALGGSESAPLTVRLVCSSERGLDDLRKEGALSPRLLDLLRPNEIRTPRLAARVEDIPKLVAGHLRALAARRGAGATEIEQAVVREFQRRAWSGNVAELFAVVETLSIATPGRRIKVKDARAGAVNESPSASVIANERNWIVESLRRHRYRRGETAVFLGVTRKTLYNKMRRYKIFVDKDLGDYPP